MALASAVSGDAGRHAAGDKRAKYVKIRKIAKAQFAGASGCLEAAAAHPDRDPFRQISIAISRKPAIAIWVSQPSSVAQFFDAVGGVED
jgi:hypothetical protein